MNNFPVVSQSVAREIGKQLTEVKKGLDIAGKAEVKAKDIHTDEEHQFITAEQLAKIETGISSDDPISNNTVIFSQAAARTNITSGENLSALFGKIMKFFTDLKTVAFTGSYTDLANRPTLGTAASQAVVNNCTTTAAGSVLDARQGQVLQTNINTVNSNLTSNVNAITGTWLGNNKLSYDGTNFWATASNGVKKKLGNPQKIILSDYFYLSTSIQVSSIWGYYRDLTIDNFGYDSYLYFTMFHGTGSSTGNTATLTPTLSYNPNTGILTAAGGRFTKYYEGYYPEGTLYVRPYLIV